MLHAAACSHLLASAALLQRASPRRLLVLLDIQDLLDGVKCLLRRFCLPRQPSLNNPFGLNPWLLNMFRSRGPPNPTPLAQPFGLNRSEPLAPRSLAP
jgi:hypothetical protein